MVKNSSKLNPVNIDVDTIYNQNTLFNKGSEAYLYIGTFMRRKVVIKERKQQLYREPNLDSELRFLRTRLEARIMKVALKRNLSIPQLLGVDLQNLRLILEYIDGTPLGFLEHQNKKVDSQKIKAFYIQIGIMTGKLHNLDIIHGDLTPFNVLITNNFVYLIDFGLSFFSPELEAKTMDLFILKRAIQAFNPLHYEEQFNNFIKGYEQIIDITTVKKHLKTIAQRGRYVKRNQGHKK
jgi:Kae1-associated kinase Bud32